tara:strand:- start:570 stop:722 length:153 start_codon:yes stop_codon:yes gene_type:complete
MKNGSLLKRYIGIITIKTIIILDRIIYTDLAQENYLTILNKYKENKNGNE